jgi:hypothetical protein
MQRGAPEPLVGLFRQSAGVLMYVKERNGSADERQVVDRENA